MHFQHAHRHSSLFRRSIIVGMTTLAILSFGARHVNAEWVAALLYELKHAYGDESVLEFDLRSWVPNPLHQKEEKVEQFVDGAHEQTVLGL